MIEKKLNKTCDHINMDFSKNSNKLNSRKTTKKWIGMIKIMSRSYQISILKIISSQINVINCSSLIIYLVNTHQFSSIILLNYLELRLAS